MSQLLTSSVSWDVGSLPSSRRSHRPHFCSSGCQSRCSDKIQLLLTVASNAGPQQTPRGCTVWCVNRHPGIQGASWVKQTRRQVPRRTHADPMEGGKPVCWDVTVVSTLTDSYLHLLAQTAGGAAPLAASRKETKYSDLPSSYTFQPLAFETLVPLNASSIAFVMELGCRLL